MDSFNQKEFSAPPDLGDFKFGREFVFFNPFDDRLLEYVNRKKAELVQRERDSRGRQEVIKGRAFTEEAKDLIGSILTPPDSSAEKMNFSSENIGRLIDIFVDKYSGIKVSPYLTYLNEAYFDNITEKELIQILRYFTHSVRIYSRAFSVMKYDRLLGAYKTMTYANLNQQDKENLYLQKRDPLFRVRKDRVTFIRVTDELKADIFFSKRFSKTTLDKMHSLLIIPMHRLHVLSYLIFFYFTPKGEKIYPNLDQPLILSRLAELAPALKSFIHENIDVTPDRIYKELRKDLQAASNMGTQSIMIMKIHPEIPITEAQFKTIKNNLNAELGYNDKIILVHAGLLYVMIEKSDPQFILSLLRKTIPNFRLETRNFPDFGYNYYSYF